MKRLTAALARRIWPEWASYSDRQQASLQAELLTIFYSLPLLALTTYWLVVATDFTQLSAQWPLLLLLTALNVLAGRIYYFQIVGREAGKYGFNSSDLENVLVSSAVLILGPVALWTRVAGRIFSFLTGLPEQGSPVLHANWLRNLLFNLWAGNLSLLGGITVYQALGGRFPLSDLAVSSLIPAFAFVVVEFLLSGLTLWFLMWQHATAFGRDEYRRLLARRKRVMRFFIIAGLPSIFGILGAVLYAQMGLAGFLFFASAVLLVSYLARRQSQAAVLSEQRARQLAQLEELGRAFIQLSSDLEELPVILQDYLPHMFDYDQAEVRLVDDTVLLQLPPGSGSRDPRLWDWLQRAEQPAAFVKGDVLPWSQHRSSENLLLAPIRHTENNRPLGGISLRSSGRFTTFGFRESLPSLQVLAAQIASVLHRREAYEKRLALERITQELALARQMQVSFLPESIPSISGWELRARLEPARQASGDFYDVIDLGHGRFGLLVADVADKGMSAALFMALSRTLLRTYAFDHPEDPGSVLRAANQRILTDTTDDSFVTVFYGLLESDSGRLRYANAGHNPPYILGNGKADPLCNTGMPLGIQNNEWLAREARVEEGELLVLYSDGVTDAHNDADELFGVDRLLHVVRSSCDLPLARLESVVLQAVTSFAGNRTQFDDVTLLLARRLAQ